MINEIVNEVKGKLLDTTLEKFPSEKIKKKRIIGKDYSEDEDYKKDAKKSSVYQHRFFYEDIDPTEVVVSLSGDGLLRFFNNINYEYFINFIQNHLLFRLKQQESGPFNISLDSYTISDIEWT